MEQFSYAYVRAVASAAGFDTGVMSMDYDSVDLIIRGRSFDGPIRNPTIDLQLKATHQNLVGDVEMTYQLKRKNYDDLRATNVAHPQLLVVVQVPGDRVDWLEQDETALRLRRCGYWKSLRGQPEIETDSVMVKIPRVQQFTVANLNHIMSQVSQGEML
jgi:hypothetical protein